MSDPAINCTTCDLAVWERNLYGTWGQGGREGRCSWGPLPPSVSRCKITDQSDRTTLGDLFGGVGLTTGEGCPCHQAKKDETK